MRRISCIEGEPFYVEPALRDSIRASTRRLSGRLRPRLRLLSENEGYFTVSGVIGAINVNSNTVLDVAPKTRPEDDWIHAVLDLLIGTDRVDVAGERISGLSTQRRNLLDVLAAIYAARLQRALRRDGPIQLLEREYKVLPHLKGKLRATTWLRNAVWAPHRLPVTFDQLTPNNDFSRGLASVAALLAKATNSLEIKSILLKASRELRPGFGEEAVVSKAVASRRLPPQWSIYEPAWSIAAAVLAERFLIGSAGRYHGISVTVEAWPLLERLLGRSLSAAVRLAAQLGMYLTAPSKFRTSLLDQPAGSAGGPHAVEPDGRLTVGAKTVATFEAKYKRRPENRDWPSREDIYQAVATAAACGARLAVLVYPEEFATAWWRVRGFGGYPERLAAVGLGLFSYRAGTGDDDRGRRLLDVLNRTHKSEADLESIESETEV